MKIDFKSKKLKKQLTEPKTMRKMFGTMANKVNQRMKELRGVENLSDMKLIPAARCHELKGDKGKILAVDVSGNYRLLFQPSHNPLPVKIDGGLDWQKVKEIKILAIEDYH